MLKSNPDPVSSRNQRKQKEERRLIPSRRIARLKNNEGTSREKQQDAAVNIGPLMLDSLLSNALHYKAENAHKNGWVVVMQTDLLTWERCWAFKKHNRNVNFQKEKKTLVPEVPLKTLYPEQSVESKSCCRMSNSEVVVCTETLMFLYVLYVPNIHL